MEEPDRGQGKVVIELNNGKQEKTTAVEVHTLHKLLCEREVKSKHVAETWLRTHRYPLCHRSQSPAMLAAWPVTIHCPSLPHWAPGFTMHSFALRMVPQLS